MTTIQKEKIKDLLQKYNDILLVSMRLAVAEDFTNLIITNQDDSEFELSDLLKNKNEYTSFIFKQFLKLNSSIVVKELSSMKETKFRLHF